MKRQISLMIVLLLALALAACGVLQEPEAASGTIEAIPLATQAAGVVATAVTEATEVVVATEPAAEALSLIHI